jgi:hypothetical protein
MGEVSGGQPTSEPSPVTPVRAGWKIQKSSGPRYRRRPGGRLEGLVRLGLCQELAGRSVAWNGDHDNEPRDRGGLRELKNGPVETIVC